MIFVVVLLCRLQFFFISFLLYLLLAGYDGPLQYSMIAGNPDVSTLPENRTMETDITTGTVCCRKIVKVSNLVNESYQSFFFFFF